MGRKIKALELSASPLVLVLAQVRISPVLKMEDYIPAIQEQMRHQGFPKFRPVQTREVIFSPQAQFRESIKWVFLNKECTQAATVSHGAVAFHTNTYKAFEDFSTSLGNVLSMVSEEVGVSIAERIGLRYVDLILPGDDESLEQYLADGLHGIKPSDVDVQRLLAFYEARCETIMGRLLIRLHQYDNGAILPPDLMPPDLNYTTEVQSGKTVTLLDTDHSSEEARDFKVESLIEDMWGLHEYTDKAFRSSVTSFALSQWGAK